MLNFYLEYSIFKAGYQYFCLRNASEYFLHLWLAHPQPNCTYVLLAGKLLNAKAS